jgi:hypothetical protein
MHEFRDLRFVGLEQENRQASAGARFTLGTGFCSACQRS